MIRVLVADDFPLVREALIAMLGRDPGIDVVATAEDGADMLNKARALRPDVVVLDLQMPGMSGMTALCRLTAELRGVRVLVLTAAVDPELVVDAASSGAAGYLDKGVSGEELVAAVAAVPRGEAGVAPAPGGGPRTGLPPPPPRPGGGGPSR